MADCAETNKELIRRLLAEVDEGRVDVVDDYYSPDYVDHTPSPILMSRPTLGTATWRSAPNLEKSWVPVSSDTS